MLPSGAKKEGRSRLSADRRFGVHQLGARTIPLDLLRSGKQMTRAAPDEAAKDRADVQALAAARRT